MKLYVSHTQSSLSRVYHSLYFPPVVIFAAIFVITLFTCRAAGVSLNQDLQTAAGNHIHTTEQAIRTNLNSYEEILQGGVGLFQGSNEVTPTDWSNYLHSFHLNQNYTGVQAIGFNAIVTPDQTQDLSNYMSEHGIANYAIYPSNPNASVYAPVQYIMLVASKSPAPYGFDMYSETHRHDAMLQAQTSGVTTITGGLTATTPSTAGIAGFNMYVPYYDVNAPQSTVAERQAAIRGYVFAGFRSSVFFVDAISNQDSKTAGFRIQSMGDEGPLYISPHYNSVNKRADTLHITRQLPIYGKTWDVQYVFTRSGLVSTAQLRRPKGILIAGVLAAVLIATIVLQLLRGRARDLAVQKEQDVALAKDELLSLASHQLRTPATGVKQYLGMVLQGFTGKISDEQETLLQKAYASNDRQLQIINEILHLAKIDAGRIVLARSPTNINDLMNDIIAEQKPDLTSANHKLEVTMPKKSPIMNVDAHMLRMAIENVLSNAIKYTPRGGKITIKLFWRMRHLYISISDTGVGIAPSDQGKMFQQFTRLPNEMSQQVGGTGVGLYLAKHLVGLHDGIIAVTSQEGKGSTFSIILPPKT